MTRATASTSDDGVDAVVAILLGGHSSGRWVDEGHMLDLLHWWHVERVPQKRERWEPDVERRERSYERAVDRLTECRHAGHADEVACRDPGVSGFQ